LSSSHNIICDVSSYDIYYVNFVDNIERNINYMKFIIQNFLLLFKVIGMQIGFLILIDTKLFVLLWLEV